MYNKDSKKNSAGISLSEIARSLDSEIKDSNSENLCYGVCALNQPQKNHIAYTTKKKLVETSELKELACIITDKNCKADGVSIPIIKVPTPQLAVISLQKMFYILTRSNGEIADSATVAKDSKLGSNVQIGANVVIYSGVEIGDNTIIDPNTVIYEDCKIGAACHIHANVTLRSNTAIKNSVIIQSGSVIGGDGFGYLPDPEKGIISVPQTGNVEINDFAEIGANTCIDRAAIGTTKIGRYVKVDNQVQIGHNVEIGDFSLICGMVAIAGSTIIGNQVIIGGASAIQGHIKIVDKVRLGGGSVVRRSIKKPGDYAGDPVKPLKEWRKDYLKKSKDGYLENKS